MKYVVRVTETLVKDIIVDAEDEYKAVERAEDIYEGCEVILDSSDFVDKSIETLRKATEEDEQYMETY